MFLPLKLPAGVSRPGTKYDSRGRWYDSQLVRWFEGAMAPVGGWQVLERTATVAVSAAISDDGGSLTDETTDANDAGADDIVLVPASPAANDAFYIGYSYRFSEVQVNTGTGATSNTIVWEYYNGSAWVALEDVTDGTNAFATTGTKSVVWTLPWDWAKTSVNSQGPYYYVRARITNGGGAGTGTQIWIGKGPIDVDAPVRGLIAWRANDQTPHLALGTNAKLFAYAGGVLTDITPVGFTTGGADASLSSANYGAGAYGVGPYGTGDASQSAITDANTWQMDTYGEDLVAVAYSDGDIIYWDKSAGGAAAALTNAPTDCKGVVVTPERFIVALAASADGRLVKWSDQEAATTWTAATNNQAGEFTLPGTGQILAGKRGRGETLIWTDVDLFTMRYIGGEFVYRFDQIGSHCGAISRRSMAVLDGKAAWMGHRGFFLYDGFVRPLPCEVADYVFSDINRTQASKIHGSTLAEFGEFVWFYPSSGSTEVDRYVKVNVRDGSWAIGQLERTSAVDRDAFTFPIRADASGVIYQHETGTDYLDTDGTELTPYAESGPIELGNGDNVMYVKQFIPDEKTLGDAEVSFFTAFYPTADETESGPYTLGNPTSLRISGRQTRVRVEQVRTGWRWGTPRLDVVASGKR